MNAFSHFVGVVCLAALDIITLAMTIRAVMSWFASEENAFMNFLATITEPLIMPVRKLLEKVNFMSGMPIDFSFIVTYMLLFLLRDILGFWF